MLKIVTMVVVGRSSFNFKFLICSFFVLTRLCLSKLSVFYSNFAFFVLTSFFVLTCNQRLSFQNECFFIQILPFFVLTSFCCFNQRLSFQTECFLFKLCVIHCYRLLFLNNLFNEYFNCYIVRSC